MKIEIEIEPFVVPNFVRAKSTAAFPERNPAYALGELDEKSLDELCNQFRADIFAKAKQQAAP